MPKNTLDFDPESYAPVAARVELFYDRYPTGRILTELVQRTEQQIVFRASVYRTAEDREPAATGWAAERVGDGEINAVACLENLLEEPCEAWVALPPDLPSGRHVALRVVGDSMTPLLHSGDVVLVDLGGAVVAGAVVVARHPEHGYVVKRVGRMRAWGLPLESLNPAYPALVLAPGAGALIGPVVLRWCAHAQTKPRLASAP